jgi:hypothetical protein
MHINKVKYKGGYIEESETKDIGKKEIQLEKLSSGTNFIITVADGDASYSATCNFQEIESIDLKSLSNADFW